MTKKDKLYMVILGATPKGRLTEQHDVFFGIADSLKALVPQMIAFWPEAEGKIHIDSWREVTSVDGFAIEVVPKESNSDKHLFFLNLGGYKPNDLEEYHYKLLAVAENMAQAVKQSKTTAFYLHYGFKGAESHVDDKHGIDVDDLHKVSDILPAAATQKYSLRITKTEAETTDLLHIGYLKIEKLMNSISH